MRQFVGLLLFSVGLTLLGFTAGPILLSEIKYSLTRPPKLIDPSLPTSDTLVDYTSASTWFDIPASLPVSVAPARASSFLLSIPSLKLTNIPVSIYSTDLKTGPILYPNTALPGGFGNPVIFGHSTLPSLYKPRDPFSIFNPLPQIKLNDQILATYDHITYKYLVKNIGEVKPTQTEVLSQRFDHRELTLITCVPLGTYLRRLVVTAELVN